MPMRVSAEFERYPAGTLRYWIQFPDETLVSAVLLRRVHVIQGVRQPDEVQMLELTTQVAAAENNVWNVFGGLIYRHPGECFETPQAAKEARIRELQTQLDDMQQRIQGHAEYLRNLARSWDLPLPAEQVTEPTAGAFRRRRRLQSGEGTSDHG